MALIVLKDRVQETTNAPGTGTATLLGAVTGYQTFSSAIGNGNLTYYTITDQTGGANWEVGIGTVGAGTLARTTVLASSNAGSLVNFSTGTQLVFCDYPATKAINLSDVGYVYYDFSNATLTSRVNFQTSTTNGTTGIYALPNGTSTAASWQATNAADPTNASKILIATNGTTDVQLVSGRNGSGTYLPLTFYNNGAEKMRLATTGNVSIGTGADGTALLQLAGSGAGAASTAPLKFNTGTLLITPEAGTYEYTTAGGNFTTPDTTSGRSILPSTYIYRLGTSGTAALGPFDFFGATSSIQLAATTTYEITWELFIAKATAGTATFTIVNSAAPTSMNAYWRGSVSSFAANGTSTEAGVVNVATASTALPVTGSLTTGVNEHFTVKALILNNTASNVRLQITTSAGTVQALAGSYYTVTRLSTGNVGNFAA